MLKDHKHRTQATDPRRSFIVQAPAGSGKTEMLTQRFLRLLATVQAPEQIIALTFTRKAAHEMRERIFQALQQTAHGASATSKHQQQTYAYAANALTQDKKLNWELLQQPGRLRILTIDSLCQKLSHAIPLQDKHIPYAQISDKPQQHYTAAATACLNHAIHHDPYQPSIKILLQHLDNRQDHLIQLFSHLLANRDQWLILIHQARLQDKTQFEAALSWIEQHELSRFCDSIPAEAKLELMRLASQVASIEADPESPRNALRNWNHVNQLNREYCRSLASLLLTSQNKLRQSFDHHVGLKRGVCPMDEYQSLKTASKILLTQLNDYPDFLEALLRVKNLPAPEYDPEQWEVLQALLTLLPLLAAHLHLVFDEHHEVDFIAISEQALDALGEEDNPTDLALYLDHQIHHLLIDEFQDTSIQQFHLLTQLVQGWQADEGKTLFVVGDPMQSIYRFRAAEVGLFLRAKRQGIGPVSLIPLELTCNFRATPTLIDWVNRHFRTIFPKTEDIESGAISFHPSDATQTADDNSVVKALQFEDSAQEAQALLELVTEELQTHPDDDIAILVRSRNQLTDIMRLLREEQIPFQGVEIDLLAKLPHLRDVWSLTQALLMPANRLAWLALLRSPWCGLSLSDLHRIANFNKRKSIYWALSQLEHIQGLSEEGYSRAKFIHQVLHHALINRHQQSLVAWLTDTLNHLHIDYILDNSEQDDLEQYWRLLDQFEQEGQIGDWEAFQRELNQLYSQRVTPSRLQIMTIHKSKGLEFDCIILPGLSAKSSNQDASLLRWLKLPTQHEELLLVSPMKAAHHERCLLYDYLGKLDTQKNQYEQQRLLYVATTRAKKRLYLFDHRDKGSQGTFRHLLHQQEFTLDSPKKNRVLSRANLPELFHLPIHFYQQPPTYTPASRSQLSIHVDNHHSRLIGIVAHELLQWICDHHPPAFDDIPWELATHRLKTLGLIGVELKETLSVLKKQLQRLFTDPIGQWLIKKQDEERNEYELLIDNQGDIATRIIDRTFYEQGIRWIIDFKTGLHNEQTQTQHRQQVNEYARLLSSIHAEPIRCGLYYLANAHWVDWVYDQGKIYRNFLNNIE